MASGRPDFHPTMLLEGKHDTELIPVLVDANGQMYIVMTGQQINVGNLPSDYFKAGQAIGESPVGVVNLPSDYYKAGQAVGSVTANVNVAQTEKDRDMIGLDTSTRRQIAVDAAGIILARLKGAYGGTLKDIAVDDTGILLSRMKGAYAGVLRDIQIDEYGKMVAIVQGFTGTTNTTLRIDTEGNLLARMKGYDGAALQDVKVDASGYMLAKMIGSGALTIKQDADGNLIARLQGVCSGALKDIQVDEYGKMVAIIQGYDGSVNNTLSVDTGGNLLARMKGYDGANLQDVKVDSAGYMLAKMTGIEGANLRTVAVDANGIMKANLSAQDLNWLTVRPAYGKAVIVLENGSAVPANTWYTCLNVNGKGILLAGHAILTLIGGEGSVQVRITIDGTALTSNVPQVMESVNQLDRTRGAFYLTKYDTIIGDWGFGFTPNITFETSLKVEIHNPDVSAHPVTFELAYALVP